MAMAKDVHGAVFRNAAATLMARIENSLGQAIDQASVASIHYSVYELDVGDPSVHVAVEGHDQITLDKSNVVFDTLQNDDAWSVDEVGYNFRHEIDVTQNEAFPNAGSVYQVRFEIVPVVGQKIVFRYQLRCI